MKPPLKGTNETCTTKGGNPPVLISPTVGLKTVVKSSGGAVRAPPILTPAIRLYGVAKTYIVAPTTRRVSNC